MNKITRVKLLIDPDMPAAKQKKIEREIKSTGISIVSKGADAGIVVGVTVYLAFTAGRNLCRCCLWARTPLLFWALRVCLLKYT